MLYIHETCAKFLLIQEWQLVDDVALILFVKVLLGQCVHLLNQPFDICWLLDLSVGTQTDVVNLVANLIVVFAEIRLVSFAMSGQTDTNFATDGIALTMLARCAALNDGYMILVGDKHLVERHALFCFLCHNRKDLSNHADCDEYYRRNHAVNYKLSRGEVFLLDIVHQKLD